MKKEDIVIELSDKVMNNISKVCFNYDLDLEHIPFSKFKIKETHENVDEYFDGDIVEKCRTLTKEQGYFDKLGESKFKEILNSVRDMVSSGIETVVEVSGRTIRINGEIGDIELTFNEGITKASVTKDLCYTLEYTSKTKKFEKYISESYEGRTQIARTMLSVIGVLTYLQIPNKSKEVLKTSRIDVENKKSKSKKKSSKQSKTYIYKTTYRIDSIADNVDLEERRSYERKTEEWTARGHWRTLRSGKKIWIKESKRKSKIPVSNSSDNTTKEYKITKVDL